MSVAASILFLTAVALQDPEPRETPGALHLPEGGAEVPMLDLGGRPMVELSAVGADGERAALRVLLDTGSMLGLALSPDACARLGLEPTGTIDLGGGETRPRFLLGEVWLGDAALSDVPVTEAGFVAGSPGLDGVIGFPSFEPCLLTLDFAGKRVLLTGDSLAEDAEALPFRRDEVLGFGMTVDVDVAGTRVPAHVDSGSPSVAMFSNATRDRLALAAEPRLFGRARTPMGDADIFTAPLDGTLRLGPIAFERPDLRFSSLPQIAGRPMGNLGSAFFRNARLTIDQRAGRCRIDLGAGHASSDATTAERPEPERPETVRRRLGVQLAIEPSGENQRLRVALVVPGSEAARVGLAVGDVLLSVDGGAATQAELGAALGGRAPIRLKVLRDGAQHELLLFEPDGGASDR